MPQFKKPIENSLENSEKFYRQITDGELFMLWRDKELPFVLVEKDEDTDAKNGDIRTFWFKHTEPIQLTLFRNAYLELSPEKVDASKLEKGHMRFDIDHSYDNDSPSYYKTPEYYLKQKVKLEDVTVFIEEYWKKVVYKKYLDIIKSLDKDDIWVLPDEIGDLFAEIINHEYGENLPVNVIKESSLVSNKNHVVTISSSIGNNYSLKEETARNILKQIGEFLSWIQTLPEKKAYSNTTAIEAISYPISKDERYKRKKSGPEENLL